MYVVYCILTEMFEDYKDMKVKAKATYVLGISCIVIIALLCIGIMQEKKEERYNSAFKAMVYITNRNQSGNGSIYKIEEDKLIIVTTYHLLQDAENVMVYFLNQTIAPGKVIHVNEEHDVGFVEVECANLTDETRKQIAAVEHDEKVYDSLNAGDFMEYRYLEWNGGHVSATAQKGSIGHMDWYIEDFNDYFVYNYCDVVPGMSGCAAVAEDGSYIGMMIGGVSNESGALSAKVIEKIYSEIE